MELKEIAKELKRELKKKYSNTKFSVTSAKEYSVIYLSFYDKNNVFEEIKQAVNSFISANSYKVDVCYNASFQ